MKYTISSLDNKWHAEVSACHGANIIKLQFKNQDIFVPFKSEQKYNDNPFIVGSPMLLPANRTYMGKFKFQGKKYELPINDPLKIANLHGFLYSVSFDVVELFSNKIVLCYQNNGNIYPFSFKITVEYLLENEGLYQHYVLANTGDRDMPFTFALHTTFVEPEFFMVPIDSCQQKDKNHIPTGEYVELNKQESLYTTGSRSKGVVISGFYHSNGNTARIGNYKYTVSEEFDHWVLYNGSGNSDFLCIEPQCGAVNGLNIENGFKILSVDEQIEFSAFVGEF